MKNRLFGASGFVTGLWLVSSRFTDRKQEVHPDDLRQVHDVGKGMEKAARSCLIAWNVPRAKMKEGVQELMPGMALSTCSLWSKKKSHVLCKECSPCFVYDVAVVLLPLETEFYSC